MTSPEKIAEAVAREALAQHIENEPQAGKGSFATFCHDRAAEARAGKLDEDERFIVARNAVRSHLERTGK